MSANKVDKFEQLRQEIQEFKQQQTSDHQRLLVGLAAQRDRTREVGGMLRLVADQMIQVAAKVEGLTEEQSKAEARLRNSEDRWSRLFGALEQQPPPAA